MTKKPSARLRPPESLELRDCPDPVDGRKAFITRRVTKEHCLKLQSEGFHACGGCVHASSETVAKWRDAMDLLLGGHPSQKQPSFTSRSDPFDLRLRATQTLADLEEVYCLVHRAFRAEGLPETGPVKGRINPFNRLPDARTFRVDHGDKLIGVITILPDSVLGLPTDELYHSELKALRESGRNLCEVSGLAVETDNRNLSQAVKLHLFRAAYRYVWKYYKATDICVLAPSHHESYYRRLLMFERLAERRVYALGGVHCPAVGLRLDLQRAPDYYKSAYKRREGMRNFYAFFVKQDIRPMNTFLKQVRDMDAIGHVGGLGYPVLPAPRKRP